MNELRKVTVYLKDNIAIILLFIYSISFINYYIFYKSFNISIFTYVGLNDLIFFTLEYVVKILLIIISSELTFFFLFTVFWGFYERIILIRKKKFKIYLSTNKRNRERIQKVFEKPFSDILKATKLYVLLVGGVFAIGLLPYKIIIFPAYLVYFVYLMEIISKERILNISIPFASTIIVLSMIFTTLYNSYSTRFEKGEYAISFKEANISITTKKGVSSLNYLGETSSNIFLYDIKSKKAKIYSKSNITHLEIENNNTVDDYIIKLEQSYPVKFFMDMLNHK